jgi:NAD(P)H-nitrite reductase large subunit
MLSDDDAPPVDRPNLSKDYLAGTAPEEWVPLRGDDFYVDNGIDLRRRTTVARTRRERARSGSGDGAGSVRPLLLATGAEPVRLPLPGMDLPHVHTLRTLGDCRAIIARAASAKRAVVMGASFIGLEVAASLRARNIDVHVVAPEKRPMERVLGPRLGDFIRGLHEEHGVVFHLEETATAIVTDGHAEERRHDRRGPRGRRRRRASAACARREGGPRDRSRRDRERIPRDQRTRRVRCRRHRALARSP